jgi:hypothetical protein
MVLDLVKRREQTNRLNELMVVKLMVLLHDLR